jgi:hypothetical protein
MERNGRFDFWLVLLLTRAITAPRAQAKLWLRVVKSQRSGWWLLLIVAVSAVGVTVHLSQRNPSLQSQAIGPAPTIASSCQQHPPHAGGLGKYRRCRSLQTH